MTRGKLGKLTPRVPLHRPANKLRTQSDDVKDNRLRGGALQARNRRLFQRNPICVECAKLGEDEARRQGFTIVVDEWDHIVPIWKGGADHETNLQGLCLQHHHIKSKREEEERRNGAITIA